MLSTVANAVQATSGTGEHGSGLVDPAAQECITHHDGEAPDHWYAWDIDSCWILYVVGAAVFGSAQDALAEWQHAVGPPPGRRCRPARPS
jgi:hypothetical protein